MRAVLQIFILITILSCNNNTNKLDDSELESFENISVRFVTGDEVKILHQISFIKEDQKIKAIKEHPFYYYGTETDSTWTSDIGKTELKTIKDFLITAKNQKDTCPTLSTSIDYYDITIANDKKIKIIGNCEWNGTDYYSLERTFFENDFLELENKRKIVTDSIVNSFIGTWKVTGLENGFISRAKVALTRLNTTQQSSIEPKVWNIDKTFRSQLKEGIDVDEGSSLIEIRGSTFKIIKIETDIIELVYLWS